MVRWDSMGAEGKQWPAAHRLTASWTDATSRRKCGAIGWRLARRRVNSAPGRKRAYRCRRKVVTWEGWRGRGQAEWRLRGWWCEEARRGKKVVVVVVVIRESNRNSLEARPTPARHGGWQER